MVLRNRLANRFVIENEIIADPLYGFYSGYTIIGNTPCLIQLLSEKANRRPLEYHLRFKRQIEQIEKLQHTHLLKPLFFQDAEETFLVYEHFIGKPLIHLLSNPKTISREEAITIIYQTAAVLNTNHQQNILHQFIKPQSILIEKTEQGLVTKLFNFGLNFFEDISRVTEEQEIIKTFGYISPEESGILRKPVDSRSDLYSLGILFYELLTGQLPYKGQDISTLIHQHIAQIPALPSSLNSEIPPVIEKIILHLLAKDPQDRYQSASGLMHDLEEYQKRTEAQKHKGPEAQRETIDFEIARQDRLKELNFSTRLIGRDKELQALKDSVKQATAGQSSVCLVHGEAGIGKSRLIDELRGYVHELHGIFAGGKCYQYEFKTPYKVIAEAIEAYIEKIKRQSQQEQQETIKRIKEALGELGGEAIKIAPTLKELIGEPPALVSLEPEKEKIRFLITVTNFIISLSSKENPLLLFLDDLQWVDDGSLEILERVIQKAPESSLMLIIGYRSNEVDENHILSKMISKVSGKVVKEEQKDSTTIPLYHSTTDFINNYPIRPFDLPETAKMISQIILEPEEHTLYLAENLYERTKGNPFFTLELLRTLYEEKIIYLQDNHYTFDREKLGKASLPTNVVDIVLKRMKDIPEEEKNILSYASIMGKEIDLALLSELTHKPLAELLNPIEDSIANQLLYRDITGQENIYFIHDRVREAFYQRITLEERVPLHQLIAFAIEEQNKTNPESVLYDLAYHFTQGQIEEKALEYSLKAGKQTQASYSNTLAVTLYNTARAVLEKQNKTNLPEYIDTLESLGEVYRLSGKFEESIEALKNVESLIPIEDKIHKAEMLTKMGEAFWEKGEIKESTKVFEQALKILGEKPPPKYFRSISQNN